MRALVRSLLAVALLGALPAAAADPFLRRTTTVTVVERVGPAVVNITTERLVLHSNPFHPFSGNPFFDRFFRDFAPPVESPAESLGSGVLIDRQGHVLTNEHVVRRASRIQVTLADGRAFEAELIGADPNNDIAVLKLDSEERLPWIEPGSSADLMVGEPVIAIGNPFGLSSTVTTGVLSAVDRTIRTDDQTFHGFLQTDASINPGNSGGPLLNAQGDLVGINTAIYQGAQGIGFAIPIDVAERVVADLLDDGEITPVWLGLDFQDLDPQLARALELPEGTSGALVNRVREDSPADRAGVRRGDVVEKVDGRPVGSARDFFEMMRRTSAGQRLDLALWRDGSRKTLKVLVEGIPDEVADRLAFDLLGLELRSHDSGGYEVQAVRKGSGAARIGMQDGDRVLAINGRPLESDDTLRRSLLELRGRPQALLVVRRGAGTYNVAIPLV